MSGELEGAKISAMEGKNGWLFLKTFDNFDALAPYTRELAISDYVFKRWARTLEQRERWFGARGIPLITQFVPETCCVYPEMLPDGVQLLPSTPFERLREYLQPELAAKIVYSRQALIEGKGEYETYWPVDSHWSEWGAYIGYRELMQRVREKVPAARLIEPGEITWKLRKTFGFLGPLMTPERSCLTPVVSRIAGAHTQTSSSVVSELRHSILTTEINDDSLPTAIVFRDSFATAMGQFLSESFRRVVYVSSHWIYYDLIEQIKPDVVIYERAERGMHYPPIEPDAHDARAHYGDLRLGDEQAATAQRRSRVQLTAGNAAEALALSDTALELAAPAAPGLSRALMHRSRIYAKLDNRQAASECLSHAMTLEPDAALPVMQAGELERSRGRSAQALALLKRATELEPGVPKYWEALAIAQLEAGDSSGAKESLRQSLDIDDFRLEPQLMLSQAMCKAGELEAAVHHAQAAIEIDRTNRYVVANLISVLVQKADWADAHAALNVALEQFPGHTEFLRYLAICETRMAEQARDKEIVAQAS